MLPVQIDHFSDRGYVRLDGFHPKKRMTAIRQNVLEELKRLSRGRSVSRSLQGLPVFQQIGRLSALVKISGLHEALVTPGLIDYVTRLGRVNTNEHHWCTIREWKSPNLSTNA